MAASLNKVMLMGNVGKDPEIRHLQSGVAVATFSLATSESYKNKNNERVTNTEWHNIVAWRGLAELIEKYVKKGDPLYIEGKITTRQWQDKDGNTRYTTEIVASDMRLLSRRDDNSSAGGNTYSNNTPTQQQASNNQTPPPPSSNDLPEPEGDDLPF